MTIHRIRLATLGFILLLTGVFFLSFPNFHLFGWQVIIVLLSLSIGFFTVDIYLKLKKENSVKKMVLQILPGALIALAILIVGFSYISFLKSKESVVETKCLGIDSDKAISIVEEIPIVKDYIDELQINSGVPAFQAEPEINQDGSLVWNVVIGESFPERFLKTMFYTINGCTGEIISE